jgi:hypothetical protein
MPQHPHGEDAVWNAFYPANNVSPDVAVLSYREPACPQCNSPLDRVRLRIIDRVRSWVSPVYRYRCRMNGYGKFWPVIPPAGPISDRCTERNEGQVTAGNRAFPRRIYAVKSCPDPTPQVGPEWPGPAPRTPASAPECPALRHSRRGPDPTLNRPTARAAREDRSVDGSDAQKHNSMSLIIFRTLNAPFLHRKRFNRSTSKQLGRPIERTSKE